MNHQQHLEDMLDQYHPHKLLNLKIQIGQYNSFLYNNIYPSPESPSSSTNEQGFYNEDWFNNSSAADHQHFYPAYSNTCTNTEVSSLDTPDILSDNHIIIPHMYFDQQPSPSTFYPEHAPYPPSSSSSSLLIPSLSNSTSNENMDIIFNSPSMTTTDETSYSPTISSLDQLSREQLIQRVVQLEMERKNNNNKDQQGDDENLHSCLWVHCQAKAPTLEKLMTHICESHVGSGKASYFCEWKDCARNKKPFMKRHKMHNHMRTHTGERPFVCTVIGCNKTFSRPDSLSTHIKTHSDVRPYLCSVPGCEKAYFHSRSLRKHVKSYHMKKSTTTAPNRTKSSSQVIKKLKPMPRYTPI